MKFGIHAIVLIAHAGVLKCWCSKEYSGPLTVVQLFTLNAEVAYARNDGCCSGKTLDDGGLSHHFPLHLLVCSSLQTAVVHRLVIFFIHIYYTYAFSDEFFNMTW